MNYINECMKEITKIGENHLEVRYFLYAKDGHKVVVHTETYGQNRIDEELAQILAEKNQINSFNVADEITKQDVKLVELEEIQTILNSKIKED